MKVRLGALSGTAWPAVISAIFIRGRLIDTLVPSLWNMIGLYFDRWFVIAGREDPAIMLVAKVMSWLTLLAVVVWAVLGAICGQSSVEGYCPRLCVAPAAKLYDRHIVYFGFTGPWR